MNGPWFRQSHGRIACPALRPHPQLGACFCRKVLSRSCSASSLANAGSDPAQAVRSESNEDTFGKGGHKIGMTRGLKPVERVLELGGASVPFPFDVHALTYTEDTPALENA